MQTIKTWAVEHIQKFTADLGLERDDIVSLVS